MRRRNAKTTEDLCQEVFRQIKGTESNRFKGIKCPRFIRNTKSSLPAFVEPVQVPKNVTLAPYVALTSLPFAPNAPWLQFSLHPSCAVDDSINSMCSQSWSRISWLDLNSTFHTLGAGLQNIYVLRFEHSGEREWGFLTTLLWMNTCLVASGVRTFKDTCI